MVVFGVFGRWFESHSSRHVGTLGTSPSLVVACMTLCSALRGYLASKFDSCNNLLSSVHTSLAS